MGIRSDVGIALKHSIVRELPQDVKKFLYDESEDIDSREEGVLFVFRDVKWNATYNEIKGFYEALKKFNWNDYIVVEACFDYPESDDGDAGYWSNNPWSLHRSVVVELCFETSDSSNRS